MSLARMPITLAESAVGDLQNIIAHYTEQATPDTGQRLVAEILDAVQLLAEQPDMGRKVPEFDIDMVRELIRPPYRIVYRRETQKIRIVRGWRCERLLKLE